MVWFEVLKTRPIFFAPHLLRLAWLPFAGAMDGNADSVDLCQADMVGAIDFHLTGRSGLLNRSFLSIAVTSVVSIGFHSD